jgi:hypothetical protein
MCILNLQVEAGVVGVVTAVFLVLFVIAGIRQKYKLDE